VEQRSDEWIQWKVGKIGCSELHCLFGSPTEWKNLLADKLAERLTGKPTERFISKDMERGTELEAEARSVYELKTGSLVTEDGGRDCQGIEGFEGSPDGLVRENGGIEIKCPKNATHLATLMDGKVKQDYIYQMAGLVYIYNAQWWDFVSYCPEYPAGLDLVIFRYKRESLPVKEVVEKVKIFLAQLEETEKTLRSRKKR
jgi:hypothetical protein